jgi:hypothetical protein
MGIGGGMVEVPGRGVLYMISPSSSMAEGVMGQEREGGNEDKRIDERELAGANCVKRPRRAKRVRCVKW